MFLNLMDFKSKKSNTGINTGKKKSIPRREVLAQGIFLRAVNIFEVDGLQDKKSKYRYKYW